MAGKAANPGKLPVLTVEKIVPVKTGSGARSSTNYHPTFKLSGWAPRGDLVFVPKAKAVDKSAHNGSGAAPSTGSQTVPPPNRMAPQPQNVDDDFG